MVSLGHNELKTKFEGVIYFAFKTFTDNIYSVGHE